MQSTSHLPVPSTYSIGPLAAEPEASQSWGSAPRPSPQQSQKTQDPTRPSRVAMINPARSLRTRAVMAPCGATAARRLDEQPRHLLQSTHPHLACWKFSHACRLPRPKLSRSRHCRDPWLHSPIQIHLRCTHIQNRSPQCDAALIQRPRSRRFIECSFHILLEYVPSLPHECRSKQVGRRSRFCCTTEAS